MVFTNQEIVFLTSVSKERMPFGVQLKPPAREDQETFIRETLQSLIKKGILDENERLTGEGADIIFFWEKYRNCKRHITLNDICVATLPGGKGIMATPIHEGYDVRMVVPEYLMYGLLKNNDFLCVGGETRREKWQDLEMEEWKTRIEEMDGTIFLREYIQGKKTDEKIYCWKGNEGWLLNIQRKRIRALSADVIRKQIYMYLEV